MGETAQGSDTKRSEMIEDRLVYLGLMEAYSPDNSCRKCGQQALGISTKYESTISGRGFMRRVCQRCGYRWMEKPLDGSRQTV